MHQPSIRECCAGSSQLFDKTLMRRTGLVRHAHDRAAITLVLSGRYDETFDRGRQRCPQWAVQYKPRGIAHDTFSNDGARMLIVALDANDGRLASRSAPAVIECGAATAAGIAAHHEAFDAAGSRADVAAIVARFLDLLEPTATPRETPPSWLTEVHDRIRRLGSPSPTMSRIARAFGVHPVYLARVFRCHYGCSIGDHLRRCRVDRAVPVLVGTDVSLASLALGLGYCDQSHFTNEFRRETGCTPSRLRTWARSSAG